MKKQVKKVGESRLLLKAKRWVLSAAIMAGGGWEVQADTATTDLSANQPINISGVLNYGYSAMIASQIFNLNTSITGQKDTNNFGYYDFAWSYYNSCPKQTYDSNSSKCECRDAGQVNQSMSASLSFGNPNPYNYSVSNVAGNSPYQPTEYSLIYQNISNGLEISAQEVSNPSYVATTPQGNLSVGDVLYEMFNGYISGNTTSPSLSVLYPQVYNIWNVAGNKTIDAQNTGTACTYQLHASVETNAYGGFVNNFIMQKYPGFAIPFDTTVNGSSGYTVSPDNVNISSPSSSSTNGLTLTSDNGQEEFVWPNETNTPPTGFVPVVSTDQGPNVPQTATNQGGQSHYCYVTPSDASNVQMGGSVETAITEQSTQTTQQGVENQSSESNSWNVEASLGATYKWGANQGVANESGTVTSSFTSGYEQAFTNMQTVNYSTESVSSTSNSSVITQNFSINGGQASSQAPTTNPSENTGLTNDSVSLDEPVAPNTAYNFVLTEDSGAVYMDASNSIALQSNGYGQIPFSINGTSLLINPGIATLVNLANNYNWVDSVQGFGGNGDSASHQLVTSTNGLVTANGAAQLQSQVNANVTLQLYEASSCSNATVAAASANKNSPQASGLKTGLPDHFLPWVASAELVNRDYIGFVSGKGFTPRLKNGRGFHIDRKDDGDSKYYVGSSGADLIRMGKGHDKVVAGDGNDIVHGAEGHDRIAAGRGKNSIYGDEGNDLLYGGPETDALLGGPGDDQLAGLGGFDQYDPGEGVDSIFMDVDAKNHVDNLELKDKINIGKYTTDNNGKLIKKANYTANHKLVESSLTGFARIVDKKSGKVVGMVRGKNGFFAANPTRWADMALVNRGLLPARLFKTNAAGLDVSTLGANAKEWYFNEGFKKGYSTYHYENLNELKADKKAFRVWLKKIAGTYGKKAIGNQSIDAIIASANEYNSATKLIRDFILK